MKCMKFVNSLISVVHVYDSRSPFIDVTFPKRLAQPVSRYGRVNAGAQAFLSALDELLWPVELGSETRGSSPGAAPRPCCVTAAGSAGEMPAFRR